MHASVNSPMSAGMPYKAAKARLHERVPAPPVEVRHLNRCTVFALFLHCWLSPARSRAKAKAIVMGRPRVDYHGVARFTRYAPGRPDVTASGR